MTIKNQVQDETQNTVTIEQLRLEKHKIDRELSGLNAAIKRLDREITPYHGQSKNLSVDEKQAYIRLLAQREELDKARDQLRIRAVYINTHYSSLFREFKNQRKGADSEPLPDVELAIKEVINEIDIIGGRYDENGKRAWLGIKRMIGALGDRAFASGRSDMLSELATAKQEISVLQQRVAQQQSQIDAAQNHVLRSLQMLRRLWRERVREIDPSKAQRGYLHRFQIDADLEREIREIIGE